MWNTSSGPWVTQNWNWNWVWFSELDGTQIRFQVPFFACGSGTGTGTAIQPFSHLCKTGTGVFFIKSQEFWLANTYLGHKSQTGLGGHSTQQVFFLSSILSGLMPIIVEDSTQVCETLVFDITGDGWIGNVCSSFFCSILNHLFKPLAVVL